MPHDIVVISLGGSLVVPDKIDVGFLQKFKAVILRHVKKGKRFTIIVGGGRTARNYQRAGAAVAALTKEDIDWLGIHATRINAHLLRAIFAKEAHPKIVKNPCLKIKGFREKILIAAGWRPGFSTDYDAVLIAKQLGAKKLINLSNINYVYDKDPKKFKGARPIKAISWREFRKLLPQKWDPGLNVPFDPVASREAERTGLEVNIISGRNIRSVDRSIRGENFSGTVIKSFDST